MSNVIDITALIKKRQEEQEVDQLLHKFKNEYLPMMTSDEIMFLIETNNASDALKLLMKVMARINVEKLLCE